MHWPLCTLPKGTCFGCGKVHHPFCNRTTDETHAIEQDSSTKTYASDKISKREKRRLATAIVAHLAELFCVEEYRDEFDGFDTADEGSDDEERAQGPVEAQDRNATGTWGQQTSMDTSRMTRPSREVDPYCTKLFQRRRTRSALVQQSAGPKPKFLMSRARLR